MIALLILGQVMAQAPDSKLLRDVESRFGKPPVYGNEPVIKERRYQLPQYPITREQIEASPVIQKALPKDAQLIELATGKVTVNDRVRVIDVHTQTDSFDYCYIRNKAGVLVYRVKSSEVVNIAADVAMYEEPRSFVEVKERKNISPFDRDLRWQPEITASFGVGSADWTRDVVNDSQARSVTGYNFGARWMGRFADRLQLGPVVQLETWGHSLENGSVNYRNVSVGVTAKSPDLTWGGFSSRLIAELRVGAFGVLAVSTNIAREEFGVRTTSGVVGWERVAKNGLGEWTWGVSWQRDWPRLRRQTIEVSKTSSQETNDLVSLHFTQGFTW